ncbi:MAG: hypothetical protein U0L12_07350 [Ruminococcus sp.]|nr:hypothetical protein [Ruminococcus sp.]
MAGILIKLSCILFGISGVCFLLTVCFFFVFKIPMLFEKKSVPKGSSHIAKDYWQAEAIIKSAKTEETEFWEETYGLGDDTDKEMNVEC